jgi:hypothetical protein
MAEPIANDWKAINDRLQQIKAEQAGSYGLARNVRASLDAALRGRGAVPIDRLLPMQLLR